MSALTVRLPAGTNRGSRLRKEIGAFGSTTWVTDPCRGERFVPERAGGTAAAPVGARSL
ncbi:hypothetical protein ACH4PR_01985 [Streptomyces mirabilis]|uniref:hypothetical protein n=1 Tax=Streptomyces mirabilis TaxID=68239 RepID=UPI0037A89905